MPKRLYWTSIFNKDGDLLPEPITRRVEDLDSDHIINIMLYCKRNNKTLPQEYIDKFKAILANRQVYKLVIKLYYRLSRI